MNYRLQIHKIYLQLRNPALPYLKGQALMREAVDLAEANEDWALAAELRDRLIFDFTNNEDDCVAIVAHHVEQFDEHPDVLKPDEDFFWAYRYAATESNFNPNNSLEMIGAIEEDLKRRLLAAHMNLFPYYANQAIMAIDRGKLPEAKTALKKMETCPHDVLWSFHLMVALRAQVLLMDGKFDEALREAKPLLEDKDEGVDYEYNKLRVLDLFAIWFSLHGRMEEAKEMCQRSKEIYNAQPAWIRTSGYGQIRHFNARICTGDVETWDMLSDVTGAHILESMGQLASLFASLAMALTAERKDTLNLALPSQWECFRSDGMYSHTELLDFCLQKAKTWRAAMDERDGTDRVGKLMRDLEQLSNR